MNITKRLSIDIDIILPTAPKKLEDILDEVAKKLNDDTIMQRFYTRHAVDEYTNAPQL